MSDRRIFDGLIYKKDKGWTHKAAANARKNQLQRQGFRVRISEGSLGNHVLYIVWYRPPSAKGNPSWGRR